jgi:hypothetical protein
MAKKLVSRLVYGCLIGVLSLVAFGGAAAQDNGVKRGSKEDVALKNRRATPKGTDIDTTATLDGLLNKKEADGWSTAKAAVVDGYVILLEREADGEHHIMLATNPGETDTTKWVIVEVTPTWGKRLASLSHGQLENLRGKHVRVTGWLYYDPRNPGSDPRGTRWEIHPVTSITILN